MFKAGDLVAFKIAPETQMVIVEVLDEEQAIFRKPEDDGVRITWNLAGFDLVVEPDVSEYVAAIEDVPTL